MIESTIQIHEHLITVLKEGFKTEFGVAVEDASDSTFTDQKIVLFKQKVFLFGEIVIKEGIKAESIKKKFKRALVFEEGSTGGVTIGQYDEVCCFLLSKKLEESNKDYAGGKIVRTVRSLDSSRRIGKKVNSISGTNSTNKPEALHVLRSNISHLEVTKTPEVIPIQKKNNSNEIFDIIDQSFWDKHKNKKNKGELIDYYLKADTDRLLPHVMMFNEDSDRKLYITPDSEYEIADEVTSKIIHTSIDNILLNCKQKKYLIKILSEGGEGKTTFLLHLSKNHFLTHNIIRLKVNSEIDSIKKYLPDFSDERPVLILLDNAMNHKNSLERYTNAFDLQYGELGFIVVLTERHNLYEPIYYFEGRYDGIYSINYKISSTKQSEFFETLWDLLDLKSNAKSIEELKNEFILSNLPFRSKVKHLLNTQGIQTKFNTKEDWENWETFIDNHQEFSSLRRLYLVVALFNKFGLSVPLKFKLLTYPFGGDSILIKKALSKTSSPQFITERMENEEYIRLRHDTAADDFFLIDSNKADAVTVLKDFFENLSDKYSASLFRNLQDHKQFKDEDYFKNLLNDEKRIELLTNYFNKTNEDDEKGKTVIRLSVLLISLRRYDEAIVILKGFLDKHNSVHAKTLLGSIYLRVEYSMVAEAERLLNQVLEVEPSNIYAKEKLHFIHQLPQDVLQHNKILVSIIYRLIRNNDLINAYENILIYKENNPGDDASFLTSKILLKSDDLKNHLFDYCLKEKDFHFAEIILNSIQDKSHISYAICSSQLSIYQENYNQAEKCLEDARLKEPNNLSLIYLLIKACRGIKNKYKERILILEFLTLNSYDIEVRSFFESLVYSNAQFTSQEYKDIEVLFNKLISTNNFIEDKNILLAVYFKWVQRNLLFGNEKKITNPKFYVGIIRQLSKIKKIDCAEEDNHEIKNKVAEKENELCYLIGLAKFSDSTLTDEDFNIILDFLKNCSIRNKSIENTAILIDAYMGWFNKKFENIIYKRNKIPSLFVFTFQLLSNAKELAKTDVHFLSILKSIEDREREILKTYRTFISS